MIFEWLSNKMRIVADVLFILFGFSGLLLPWFVALMILALAILCDYFAFSFQKKGEAV